MLPKNPQNTPAFFFYVLSLLLHSFTAYPPILALWNTVK